MRAAVIIASALSAAVASPVVSEPGAPSEIAATPLPAPDSVVLAPEASAFRTDLEAGLAGADAALVEAVVDFYAARDFAPFWAEAGREAELLDLLADTGAQGLPPARYLDGLEGVAVEEGGEAAREAALSRAFLRLGHDLAGGLVPPSSVEAEITLETQPRDYKAMIAGLEAGDVAAAVAALAPASPEYAALIAEKARLEAEAVAGGWGDPVPDGPALHEGDRDPRVAALRDRLERLGFAASEQGQETQPEQEVQPAPELETAGIVANAPAPGDVERDAAAEVFDADLAHALERFQRASGLIDDGVAGARTLEALNASVDDRMGQVLVNLERLRWLGDLGERYVYVNVPDFTVSVHDDGERVYHTRAVMGETATETPEFSDTMTYLVVNPTWYIPDSIARRVYLPQLRTDPGVIARSNMRLFTRSGTEIDPRLVDFSQLEAGAFPFRVRQNPSPENAMGRVKFMFPNQFAIYLHDTPARQLFDRDARAFSNGCVRLEEPFEFAHYLLEGQLDDPEATFAEWVAAGSERYVTLDEPIRVHLTYRTAFVDDEGAVNYRADVYGRDRAVLGALAEHGVSLPGPRG